MGLLRFCQEKRKIRSPNILLRAYERRRREKERITRESINHLISKGDQPGTSAYVESIAVLQNTQLSLPEEILNGRRTHHLVIAVLKNTQPSPPETKERKSVPYGERKAV